MNATMPAHGRTAFTAGALVAVVCLAYAGSLGGGFQFDDHQMIVDNPAVHGLAAWREALPGIRPLLKLSQALNWTLSPAPLGFHLFNLAAHALNTLLLWRLARHWLAAFAPRVERDGGAFAVALLFALHPAATEAVTYISGRSISLAATLYLAALLAHAGGIQRDRRDLVLLWSPLLFAAALAVRETAITLPLALLATAWFGRQPLRAALSSLRGHAVVVVLAAAAALATPGYRSFFGWSLKTRDLGEQALAQLEAHRHLLFHTLLGLRTNIDPDLRVPDGLTPGLAAMTLLLAAAAALAAWSRRRRPWLGFGIAWYLLHLAPSNSLLPRFDLANDRHLYLALPGVALVLVATLRPAAGRRAALAAVAALALLLGAATVRRNADYRDETALWEATVRDSPGKPRAWINFGYARQLAGDIAGARAAYACALALDPGNEQAAINLAVLDDDGTATMPPSRCPSRD